VHLSEDYFSMRDQSNHIAGVVAGWTPEFIVMTQLGANHRSGSALFCNRRPNTRMRPLCMLLLISLIAVTVGCAIDETAMRTEAPDGLYRWEHDPSKGYVIQVIDSAIVPRVSEITSFTPQRFVVAAFHPNAETDQVSVEREGRATEEMRDSSYDIVVIINHKLYNGIATRTGASGQVVVITDTRKQAEEIISMLRNRYRLSP